MGLCRKIVGATGFELLTRISRLGSLLRSDRPTPFSPIDGKTVARNLAIAPERAIEQSFPAIPLATTTCKIAHRAPKGNPGAIPGDKGPEQTGTAVPFSSPTGMPGTRARPIVTIVAVSDQRDDRIEATEGRAAWSGFTTGFRDFGPRLTGWPLRCLIVVVAGPRP